MKFLKNLKVELMTLPKLVDATKKVKHTGVRVVCLKPMSSHYKQDQTH